MEGNVSDKKERRKRRGLVGILVFLLIVIIGLSIGIAVNLNRGDNDTGGGGDSQYLSSLVSDWLDNESGDEVNDDAPRVDINEVIEKLEYNLYYSNSEEKRVQAAFDLSLIYDDEEVSEILLKTVLKEELVAENRYRVLLELKSLYDRFGNSEKKKWVLSELLEIPDDAVIVSDDWSAVKPLLEEELNLMNGG